MQPSTEWLPDLLATKRADVLNFFAQYRETAGSMQLSHRALKTALRRYTSSEARTSKDMRDMMDTLKSINIEKLKADLADLHADLNASITQYRNQVISNNDLAGVLHQSYNDSQEKLREILQIVAALQDQMRESSAYIDEYKRVMGSS